MNRTAHIVWTGAGKTGKGNLTLQSRLLENAPYSYVTRFENEKGTNPEELIAAAHGGCFSMKLSFIIGEAGYTPDVIETTASVGLDKGVITGSHLIVKARVPGMSAEQFEECAKNAKENCPVSKALAIDVTMEAGLLEDVASN